MNIMPISLTNMAVVSLTLGLTAGIACAQTDLAKSVQEKAIAAVSKLQSSCAQDIASYCSTVTPGESRILLCMEAHDDKLSPQCLYELHETAQRVHMAADRLKEVTFVCRDDIVKLCAPVKPGQGRIAQCLLSNKAMLSKGCTTAVENLQAAAEK